MPDADTELMKADLATEIVRILRERDLTGARAAELAGTTEADISRIRKASLDRFTIDRLVKILTASIARSRWRSRCAYADGKALTLTRGMHSKAVAHVGRDREKPATLHVPFYFNSNSAKTRSSYSERSGKPVTARASDAAALVDGGERDRGGHGVQVEFGLADQVLDDPAAAVAAPGADPALLARAPSRISLTEGSRE